jgi:2-C-methyl-D-erythritol 4-phosphate cytidylyltransferase/2-C-methyl-D-erythritol 2,4-cyclodiphosphate synthase
LPMELRGAKIRGLARRRQAMESPVVGIIPAAGFGTRMGADTAKQYLDLGGMPILTRTIMLMAGIEQIQALVVVAPPGQEDDLAAQCITPYGFEKPLSLVSGGKERQDSVANGLSKARELGAEHVLIHDAARPLAPAEVFERVLEEARQVGAAVAAVPCYDTVKESGQGDMVRRTLDRSSLWMIQTPQGFALKPLEAALKRARNEGFVATDEAGLLERYGHGVKLVMGARQSMKITEPGDLRMAHGWLLAQTGMPRVGQGMDVHQLVPDRPLILGGVSIPYEKGLLGHSDADVLSHAVMDALLAAAGLGDIGGWFPDDDPAYQNADSLELMADVVGHLAGDGLEPAQVSVTLVAQKPKVAPYVQQMRSNLAEVLGLSQSLVNIAATTTEKLGFTGRGEGMAAWATAMLKKKLDA